MRLIRPTDMATSRRLNTASFDELIVCFLFSGYRQCARVQTEITLFKVVSGICGIAPSKKPIRQSLGVTELKAETAIGAPKKQYQS